MQPYIGITGFMTNVEVLTVLEAMPKNSNRLLMVGVLASLKTLKGQQNKWPNRYPIVERISEVFLEHPGALNLIHYNTKEPETLSEQLARMTKLGGHNFHGFQLNLAWPSVVVLEQYRRQYKDRKIVLQIGGHAFEMVGHSPEVLANRVAEYVGVVEYVLLDPSGGLGAPLDTEEARKYLEAIQAKNLDLGLGVAGGLSPATLHLVEPLVPNFPNLSIDAEGRLRGKEDNLNLNTAKQYLLQSVQLFQ